MSNSAFPLGYIVFAAFASLTVWGIALLEHLPIR